MYIGSHRTPQSKNINVLTYLFYVIKKIFFWPYIIVIHILFFNKKLLMDLQVQIVIKKEEIKENVYMS